jgi:hypothetical protein
MPIFLNETSVQTGMRVRIIQALPPQTSGVFSIPGNVSAKSFEIL